MSGYTLTWKGDSAPHPRPADGAFLRADLLGTLDRSAIEAAPVMTGNPQRKLGEFFDISGEPSPDIHSSKLTVRNAPRWSRVGARMAGGELVIEGDAGDELGASMTGGVIRVTGSAGHRVAGPDFGTTRGANGGVVFVRGNIGDHAGLRMRRGLIVAGGTAGASPGFRMLAGTIVIAGGPLDHPLLEARRGTVLSLQAEGFSPGSLGAHLASDGRFPVESVAVLRLLLSQARALGLAVDERTWSGNTELWSGDRFELGKGECWQWVS
jgi:formylmethanofuran dehydrogenase subunit C